MNKKQNSLIVQMGIFSLIIILLLGLIIINEIKPNLTQKKVDQKLTTYITDNYQQIIETVNIRNTTYKNGIYQKRVENKINKNLYFIVKYKNKKISTTYKEDYEEGQTLIKKVEKEQNQLLQKKLKNTSLKKYTISLSYNIKLNNCTNLVKNKFIKEAPLLNLSTINVEKTILFDKQSLNNELLNLNNIMESLKITPKNYNLTYTNINDMTKTINIKLNSAIIKSDSNIISEAIITNNKPILDKYEVIITKLN